MRSKLDLHGITAPYMDRLPWKENLRSLVQAATFESTCGATMGLVSPFSLGGSMQTSKRQSAKVLWKQRTSMVYNQVCGICVYIALYMCV